MSLLRRKRQGFIPSRCGEEDDTDTRTRDVVTSLSYEVTRLMGVTEQLQDLIETFAEDKDAK